MLDECCYCILLIIVAYLFYKHFLKEGMEVCVSKNKYDVNVPNIGIYEVGLDTTSPTYNRYADPLNVGRPDDGHYTDYNESECSNFNTSGPNGGVAAPQCAAASNCDLIEIADTDSSRFTELCTTLLGSGNDEPTAQYLEMKCLTASDSEEKARYCEILNACVAEQSSVAVTTERDKCSSIGMEYDPEIDRYKEAGNSICVYKGEGRGGLGNFYEATDADVTHAAEAGTLGLCEDDSYVLRNNTGSGIAHEHFSCIPCSNPENNKRVWDGNRCVNPDTSNIQDIGPENLESSYGLDKFRDSSYTNRDPMVFYKRREDPSSANLPEGQGFFKDTIRVTSCNSIPTNETIVNEPPNIISCKTSTEKCTFDVDSAQTSPGYIGTLNDGLYNTIQQCRACNVPTIAQEVDGKNHTRLLNSSSEPAEEVVVTADGNSTCRRICGPNTTPLGINAGLLSNIYGATIGDRVPRVTGSGGDAEGTQFSVYCGTGENAGCGVGQKMIGPSTSTDLSQPLFRCETEDLNERIELATLAGMINIRGGEGSILGTDVNNAYGVYSCTGLGLKEKDNYTGDPIARANAKTFQEFYNASHENTETPAPLDDLMGEGGGVGGGYMCDKYTDCNDYTTNHGCNDGKVPNEANSTSPITYTNENPDALFDTSSARDMNAGQVDADTGDVKQLLINEKARVNTYLQSTCCIDA